VPSSPELEAGISAADDELTSLTSDVAQAVGLAEGEAGIRQVMRAIQHLQPASTRSVSMRTGLPVPVVAAVSNELRARGLVTRDRPSRLTDRGQMLLGGEHGVADAEITCGLCHGYGVVVSAELAGLPERLTDLAAQAPPVNLTLDQSHCTPDTKLRRVLFLLRYSLLPARDLLLIGDDDLMAVSVALAGAVLGEPLVRRLAVLDTSPEVLAYTGERLAALGVSADLVQHDLRSPLPGQLRDAFDLVMTDPPYTTAGARLFLSRCVEGLRPGPGRAIAFSFGPKGPDETLDVQEAITAAGLTVQTMHRNFNDYLGAGIIAGRSNLYHLASTSRTTTVVSSHYGGPLYTADLRAADRIYKCSQCGTRQLVGPGAQWRTIAQLKQAGCPVCGSRRFRPLQLAARAPATAAPPGRPGTAARRPAPG